MPIQWYPGHMAKALRQFSEKISLVDVIYELRDARVPMSSQNPELDKVIGDKPRVILLLKKDLADSTVTESWLDYFKAAGQTVVAVNAKNDKDIAEIRKATHHVLKEEKQKWKEKGLKERSVRAIMVGVPNVGKSTVINRMAGKNATRTGNRPGITQHQQWIKYGKDIELLDTPGILWPKFEEQEIGKRLALTGAIADRLLYMDDIALYGMEQLETYYPGYLAKRYKLTEAEQQLELPDMLLAITKKRGFQDDYERAADMIVNEIRKGILGQVSFDRVDDDLWKEEV